MHIDLNPATIALAISIVVHAFATIWWASKVNTTLMFVQVEIHKICETILKHESKMYSVAEAAKDFSIRDQQIAAIFRKLENVN